MTDRVNSAAYPGAGDPDHQRVFEWAYDDLRRQARALMGRERRSHTLTPTALVHEAYLRLFDETGIEGFDRVRFFRIAARAMRNVLVDHARARDAQKRGQGWERVTIESDALGDQTELDALTLSGALDALSREDQRAAAIIELRIFGGLSHGEIAEALGISRRTVDTDWAFAKKWLSREMG